MRNEKVKNNLNRESGNVLAIQLRCQNYLQVKLMNMRRWERNINS